MHIRTSSVMILNQRHWQLLGGHWQHGKGVDRLCEKMSFQMVCRAVLWCAELYCHPPRPQAADGGAASRYRG